MEEPWETAIVEYGTVNITGFRMVDPGRRLVKDFLAKWKTLDPVNYPTAGTPFISVSIK